MYETLIVNRYKRLLVIWYNPNKDSYYYKYVSGFYQEYYIGYENQYNHVIVLIIEFIYENSKTPLRIKLIRKLISFLEKIERRLY